MKATRRTLEVQEERRDFRSAIQAILVVLGFGALGAALGFTAILF